MCFKYKNPHGTVFVWCEITNGKERRSSYLNVFTDGKEDYYENYNYCPYCGKKLEVKEYIQSSIRGKKSMKVYLIRASEWETEIDCVCATKEIAERECKRLAEKYKLNEEEAKCFIECIEMDLIEE